MFSLHPCSRCYPLPSAGKDVVLRQKAKKYSHITTRGTIGKKKLTELQKFREHGEKRIRDLKMYTMRQEKKKNRNNSR
jgi:hypothetical protein